MHGGTCCGDRCTLGVVSPTAAQRVCFRPYPEKVKSLELGPDNATLTIHTDVGGRASRFGHRLTITLLDWSARVEFSDSAPSSVRASAKTAELEITEGTGGVTPITDIDRGVIKRTALKSLDVDSHPTATFTSTDISKDSANYLLKGTLEIRGRQQECEIAVSVSESDSTAQIEAELPVVQSDFGVKPYSAILGTLKVVDEVKVRLSATVSVS